MAEVGTIDAARQEEFVGKVVEQISGTMTTLLGAIGDRLGLFKNLAEQGPATSLELASRTKLNERYLREWLGGMTTAGYLNYDGPTKRFNLPAEHASVLAQENGMNALKQGVTTLRDLNAGGGADYASRIHERVRPRADRISQWRWGSAIAIQRHDVGRSGKIHLHLV